MAGGGNGEIKNNLPLWSQKNCRTLARQDLRFLVVQQWPKCDFPLQFFLWFIFVLHFYLYPILVRMAGGGGNGKLWNKKTWPKDKKSGSLHGSSLFWGYFLVVLVLGCNFICSMCVVLSFLVKAVDFVWVVQNHFCVKPNYSWVWVEDVTIFYQIGIQFCKSNVKYGVVNDNTNYLTRNNYENSYSGWTLVLSLVEGDITVHTGQV